MKTLGFIASFVVIVGFLLLFFYPFTSKGINVPLRSTTVEPNTALKSVDKPIDSAHSNQSNIIKQQVKGDIEEAAELYLETDPELLDEAFPSVAAHFKLAMPVNISSEDMNTLSDNGEPLEKKYENG